MTNLETETWKVLHYWKKGINEKKIELKPESIALPEGLDEAVRRDWEAQLVRKRDELKSKGQKIEIKPFKEITDSPPLGALYEGERCVMWPGPAISLLRVEETDDLQGNKGAKLYVVQTSFPYIKAFASDKVQSLFTEAGLVAPRPPLALGTFARTRDEKLVLTVRGPETNMYAGRRWCQGGNPTNANSIRGHQLDETYTEILVKPDQVGEITFYCITEDKEALKRKPDLTGIAQLTIEAGKVREQFEKRPLDKREKDAIDIEFVPVKSAEALLKYLTEKAAPKVFCPGGHAALVLYGSSCFGPEWATEVLSYKRK